jgi:hypothetical protein
MAKVVSLPGCEIRAHEPVGSIVELLEALLEKARNGEVRSLAYVWMDTGDNVNHNWYRGDRYNSQLLGSMAMMQHEFIQEWNKVS